MTHTIRWRTLKSFGLGLAVTLLCRVSAAQDDPGIKIAERYLTPHTVAGVKVELSRVDFNALRRKAQDLKVIDAAEDREMIQGLTMAQGVVSSFALTGGDDLWVLVDPRDPARGVIMVMTIAPATDQAQTAEQLAQNLSLMLPEDQRNGMVILAKDDHIVMGSQQLINASERPSGRTFPEGLVADRGQVATLFAVPSKDHRRAASETLGELPPPFSDVDGAMVIGETEFATLDLTVDPAILLSAVVVTDSHAAAAAVAEQLNSVMDSLGEVDEFATQEMPAFFDAITKLEWSATDNRAVLEVGEAAGNLSPVVEGLSVAVKEARGSATQVASMNNEKQLLLGLHNFYDTHKRFPADIKDADGNLLFSWRVEILPYIEQQALYQALKLDEPWNSEHNRPLTEIAIQVFRGQDAEGTAPNCTNYLRPIGEGTCFGPKGATKFQDVTDGTSNTIALVEVDAAHAVPWAQPADLQINPENPIEGFFLKKNMGIVAMLDGSVRAIREDIDKVTLLRAMQHADGNPVTLD